MYLLIDLKENKIIAQGHLVNLAKKIDVDVMVLKSSLFYKKIIDERYRVIDKKEATNNYILNTSRKMKENN